MTRRKKSAEAIQGEFTRNGFPLVEFDRRPLEQYPLRAFVLDRSPDLTLVQVFETHLFQLNGYGVLRNSDVQRRRAIPKEDFLARAAEYKDVLPSKPKLVEIATMSDAAASAGALFQMIAIHRERIKKGVCHIGKLIRASQRSVTILSITPQAEWEGQASYRVKDITLLEFGGAYEHLLSAFAKPILSERRRT